MNRTERIETIERGIWDILADYNDKNIVDATNGWSLQSANFYSDCIWDLGVILGKVNEDGDFEGVYEYTFAGYAETYADLIEQGWLIVKSMACDIAEKVGE